MDKKIVIVLIAVIVAAGLIGGYYLLSEDDTDEDITGEWKAVSIIGYNVNGEEVNDTDREVLAHYDIDITVAEHGVLSIVEGTSNHSGTYRGGLMAVNNFNEADGSYIGMNGSFVGDELIVQRTIAVDNAGRMETEAYAILYNRTGVLDENFEPKDITIPEKWTIELGASFNGDVSALLGTNLTITGTNGPTMIGTMEQQVGDNMVNKTIIAVMIPDEEPNSSEFHMVDSTGLEWRLRYNAEKLSLKATAVTRSEVSGALTSVSRDYVCSDESDITSNWTMPDYDGKTWSTSTKWTLDDDNNVEKVDFDMTLNITSSFGRQLSGSAMINGHPMDFVAIAHPEMFRFAITGEENIVIKGVATLSDGIGVLEVYEDYNDGYSFAGGHYTLTMTDPEDGNEFLGDWVCQYGAGLVDGKLAIESRAVPEDKMEQWDISIDSIKDNEFVGKYGSTLFVGTVADNTLSSVVDYKGSTMLLDAYIDDNGNMQIHALCLNNDGTSTVWIDVYTRVNMSKVLAEATDISGDYTCVKGEKFDGTEIKDMDWKELTIQSFSDGPRLLTIFSGEIDDTPIIGYLRDNGDGYCGRIDGLGTQVSISYYDEALIISGFDGAGATYSVIFTKTGEWGDHPITVAGPWDSMSSTRYVINSDSDPSSKFICLKVVEEEVGISVVEGNLISLALGDKEYVGYLVNPGLAFVLMDTEEGSFQKVDIEDGYVIVTDYNLSFVLKECFVEN